MGSCRTWCARILVVFGAFVIVGVGCGISFAGYFVDNTIVGSWIAFAILTVIAMICACMCIKRAKKMNEDDYFETAFISDSSFIAWIVIFGCIFCVIGCLITSIVLSVTDGI